jgi:hypothetical protein
MTSKQQVALNRIIVAIEGIAVELSRVDSELVANRTTLNSFLTHLVKISKEIESGNTSPKNERESYMGRLIVDSWPFDHLLGEKIIDAEQSYLRL